MQPPPPFPLSRPRRMRRTATLRGLAGETDLRRDDLIAPLFVKESIAEPVPIASMPGHYQHTLESLRKEAAELAGLGVPALLLFGVPAGKDAEGSQAWAPEGIVQRALRALTADLGDQVALIGDLCLCEYTDHGHCGLLAPDDRVDNDATLDRYRRIAVAQAEAGADVLLVKPALAYRDVIWRTKREFGLPVAADNVSGEYAMVKAAAERGWVDGQRVMLEVLTSIRRAGADLVVTYFAREAAPLL